jgi:hypothetical protein
MNGHLSKYHQLCIVGQGHADRKLSTCKRNSFLRMNSWFTTAAPAQPGKAAAGSGVIIIPTNLNVSVSGGCRCRIL